MKTNSYGKDLQVDLVHIGPWHRVVGRRWVLILNSSLDARQASKSLLEKKEITSGLDKHDIPGDPHKPQESLLERRH